MSLDHRTEGRIARGRAGEDLAAAHLRSLGMEIVAGNVRTRQGEIDLIVADRSARVLVEVKTRALGAAELTCPSARQRLSLRRLAVSWLARRPPASGPFARKLRFDLVWVPIVGCRRRPVVRHLPGVL